MAAVPAKSGYRKHRSLPVDLIFHASSNPLYLTIQPALLDVKQAAAYLGRSEQSIQHLIFSRDLPVVRVGRRVHLHRRDLDAFIEKNKY